jgi:hypothetical protein
MRRRKHAAARRQRTRYSGPPADGQGVRLAPSRIGRIEGTRPERLLGDVEADRDAGRYCDFASFDWLRSRR